MTRDYDSFVEKQVHYQYAHELKSAFKKNLDFSPFKSSMDNISNEKYNELSDMILDKTIFELQMLLKNKKLTYQELTLFYLSRIKKYDDQKLNTIIELNPDALNLAIEADANYNENIHPLFGMPILIKDNISTGDAMHNTAGSKVLENSVPKNASSIVKKLKNIGAVILGKNNMSEWAYYMSSNGICGFSALGGQTKNPYGMFEVGGSSSGSASSVASNFAAASIGTETCGSIIYPSGQNSVIGFYPTRGVWNNDMIIPISPSLDTPGPITRTVEDAALMLWSLTENEILLLKDYSEHILESTKSLRIGLITNEKMKSEMRAGDEGIYLRVTSELEALGCEIVPVELENDAFNINMEPILEYEFNESIKDYLSISENSFVSSLSEILNLYNQNPDAYGPYGYDLIDKSVKTSINKVECETLFLQNKKLASDTINKALDKVDVLISLSNQLSTIYASAGYPSIIVPAGYRLSGEPVGVTFTAGKFDEGLLVKIASRYEKHTCHRQSPKDVMQ